MLINYAWDHFSDDYGLSRQGKIANIFPVISVLLFVFNVVMFISDLYTTYFEERVNEIISKRWERKIDKRNRKAEMKLRKEKIKLGIIRISPIDPYGEEDWNN